MFEEKACRYTNATRNWQLFMILKFLLKYSHVHTNAHHIYTNITETIYIYQFSLSLFYVNLSRAWFVSLSLFVSRSSKSHFPHVLFCLVRFFLPIFRSFHLIHSCLILARLQLYGNAQVSKIICKVTFFQKTVLFCPQETLFSREFQGFSPSIITSSLWLYIVRVHCDVRISIFLIDSLVAAVVTLLSYT